MLESGLKPPRTDAVPGERAEMVHAQHAAAGAATVVRSWRLPMQALPDVSHLT